MGQPREPDPLGRPQKSGNKAITMGTTPRQMKAGSAHKPRGITSFTPNSAPRASACRISFFRAEPALDRNSFAAGAPLSWVKRKAGSSSSTCAGTWLHALPHSTLSSKARDTRASGPYPGTCSPTISSTARTGRPASKSVAHISRTSGTGSRGSAVAGASRTRDAAGDRAPACPAHNHTESPAKAPTIRYPIMRAPGSGFSPASDGTTSGSPATATHRPATQHVRLVRW